MLQDLRIASRIVVVEGLRAMARNGLRSALAALGISVGVAAVVCVVAVGQAGTEKAQAKLHDLGDNLVWIEAGSRNINGVRSGTHGMTTLTEDDATAIQREVPTIVSVTPNVDGSLSVAAGNRNWTTHYRGVAPTYFQIKRWTIAAGRAFSQEEMEQSANVVVIGVTLREQLFGDADPLGALVRIQGQPFEVIGVLGAKGQSGTGQDQDDTLVMPYTTAQRKIRGRGFEWLDDILCSASAVTTVDSSIDQVNALLRQRHHIQAGQPDDFNIRRPDEIIKAEIESSNTLALFLASIAAVALLVGGVGIMNVMLVSVTQRTREIGLRLAIGASGAQVLVQFVGEAILLCSLGGAAGVALGIGSTELLGRTLGWPVSIPVAALALAWTASATVGFVFGLLPAIRAANLEPVEALRHE